MAKKYNDDHDDFDMFENDDEMDFDRKDEKSRRELDARRRLEQRLEIKRLKQMLDYDDLYDFE